MVGTLYAPVVVLCDPQSWIAQREGAPVQKSHMDAMLAVAERHGMGRSDFLFIGLCPPINDMDAASAARRWAHVEANVHATVEQLNRTRPRIVVTMGDLATRLMVGRAIKITNARGVPILRDNGCPILPMMSPGHVARLPDNARTFIADMLTLAMIKKAGWDASQYLPEEGTYTWETNLLDWSGLHDIEVMAVDTETQGGTRWWDPSVELLSVQLCWEPGHAIVVPVNDRWGGHEHNVGNYYDNRNVLREILEDPAIRKIGHNLKFEHHMLREKMDCHVQGWLHDTQLMAFNVDENIMQKSLDALVRIFVPEMSGYADVFNRETDKSNMAAVEREPFVRYSGGDADATLRLARRLHPLLDQDARQRRLYRQVQLPAILSFANTVERHGMLVDQDRLRQFGVDLDAYMDQTYKSLISRTPPAVKQRHMDPKKEKANLKFSRSAFTADTLFSPDGWGLTPKMWTPSTAKLPMAERVPSTSAKDHLPYFVTSKKKAARCTGNAGEFVTDLIGYQKATKMSSTYVGKQDDLSGFWKYLDPRSRIYPSYMLHRTVTGRTASADPNGQNFPNRGTWAEQYQKIFIPTPGFKLVSCDLSQIELRLVAWMAAEAVMMQIYADNGDIHAATAAMAMGITLEEFNTLPDTVRKEARRNAKPVNFGFLYGMGWRKFMIYAKTDYEVDYSERDAQDVRNKFFETYWGIPIWHKVMHQFAMDNGFVRSLHGAVRHLPGTKSEDGDIVAASLRYAVNSPIQRFGSDIGLVALNRFCAQADPNVMRIIGFIHDALVMEVREEVAEEGAQALRWTMESVDYQGMFGITPPIPILADIKIGGDERPDLGGLKPEWWNDDEEQAAAHYLAHVHQVA